MFVTLYGKGAVTVHGDQEVYHASNGQIRVPIKFAAQVKALGFSETPLAEQETPLVAAGVPVETLSPVEGAKAPPLAIGPVKTALPTTGLHYKLRDALIGIGVPAEKANEITRVDAKSDEYHQAIAAGFSPEEAAAFVYGAEA